MRYPLRLITAKDSETLLHYFKAAGVDPYGARIVSLKAGTVVVRVDKVPAAAANILKQQLLSLGGDAAVHRGAITGKPESSTIYLVADRKRMAELPSKLSRQPFGLLELGNALKALLEISDNPPMHIRLPSGKLDLSRAPVVMGILNVTPDSFSDGGFFLDPGAALERALEMVEEGAGILDVGGESTRPGAKTISVEEEIARIRPVLEKLSGRIKVPISIDTRRSQVAEIALDLGVSIINDITGFTGDPRMADLVAKKGTAAVVMHMQGNPETMQNNPSYKDVTSEILSWLASRIEELQRKGVTKDSIIVDPGIGFGKRLEHNLTLLKEIGDFRTLGVPVMIGYSRKSFIGQITGREPTGRLAGGLAALGRCISAGVSVIRVHDVRETVEFIKVWQAIEKVENAQ